MASKLNQVSRALFRRLQEREDDEIAALNDAYSAALDHTITRVIGDLPRDDAGRLVPEADAIARLRRSFERFGDEQGASILLEQHVERVRIALARQVDLLSDGWQRLGEDPLSGDELALSQVIKANSLDRMAELGSYHHTQLRDAVTRQVLGRATPSDLRAQMRRLSDRSASEADRQHHDAMIGYSRAVIEESARERGYEYFQYIGPDDSANRPFCDRHVDKVYTREEIDALDNGQTSNVFLTGGGFRCRHHWRPVRPEWFGDDGWSEMRDRMRFGSQEGGPEGTIEERPEDIYIDPVPDPDMELQGSPYSCGPACGVQLLKEIEIETDQARMRVLAKHIEDDDSIPERLWGTNAEDLADALSDLSGLDFQGGKMDIPGQDMATVVRDAEFYEFFFNSFVHRPAIIAQGTHFILVDDFDAQAGIIKLRDAWGINGPLESKTGLSATLDLEDFAAAWERGHYYFVGRRR